VSETLDAMVRAAVRASEIITQIYASDFQVYMKGPSDPVTDADRQANTAICHYLGEQFPGVPVVAEESDPSDYQGFASSERIFFVDPVDGTSELVNRTDEFVVMIGLVDGERATHGVVLSPPRQVIWVGELGHGAHRIDRNGTRERIDCSKTTALAEARVVVSRSHRSPSLEGDLRRCGVSQILQLGSAGLKSASVAEGSADAYVALAGAGKRWDVCGPDAVVSAAGGYFTDAAGRLFDYRPADLTNSQGIVAAGPLLHGKFVENLHAPSSEDNSLGKR
jgi:3'(2'), 5'-bisphosphate nucleotidase